MLRHALMLPLASLPLLAIAFSMLRLSFSFSLSFGYASCYDMLASRYAAAYRYCFIAELSPPGCCMAIVTRASADGRYDYFTVCRHCQVTPMMLITLLLLMLR